MDRISRAGRTLQDAGFKVSFTKNRRPFQAPSWQLAQTNQSNLNNLWPIGPLT
jgi:hypothetical protein